MVNNKGAKTMNQYSPETQRLIDVIKTERKLHEHFLRAMEKLREYKLNTWEDNVYYADFKGVLKDEQ
jgi:hypothetical protein